MSNESTEEMFEAIGEVVVEHTDETGTDVSAIHQEMLNTMINLCGDDPEQLRTMLEQLKLTTMNQAAMFCHLIDQTIAEKFDKKTDVA